MIPVETLFVSADRLLYLSPLQMIWCRQYFLGIPVVLLSLIAYVLLIARKFDSKRMFWTLTFVSWSALFLFAIVSPSFGIVIGWPNRFPYFVLMPMAMLAGLTVGWLEDRLAASSRKGPLVHIASYLLLSALMLSPFVHAYDIQQFTYYPYASEIRVSEWLDVNLGPAERIASFGTVSYAFNVVSNGWQLDGGYVQGQINPDLYYKYYRTLTELDDEGLILKTLNETNTRFIIMPQGMEMPSAYDDHEFFDKIAMPGYTIVKLKANYTLDLVTIVDGNATVDYDYANPDELNLHIRGSSSRITLLVKMNYYPGWIATSSQSEVILSRGQDGLMEVGASGAKDIDIALSYNSTGLDLIGQVATIIGVVIYLATLGWGYRHR